MDKINKLDDKYLVIKQEDLDNFFVQFTHGIFSTEEEARYMDQIPFNKVLDEIRKLRENHGKSENHYVVLNMSDNINLDCLRRIANKHQSFLPVSSVEVNKIAVELINCILEIKKV